MTFFDLNVHLPSLSGEAVGRIIGSERESTDAELQASWENLSPNFDHHAGINVMLFNENFAGLEGPWPTGLLTQLRQRFECLMVTQLLDPRLYNSREHMLRLREKGVTAIKFHSYVQDLTDDVIPLAVACAKMAAEEGLMICIDASYGGRKLYQCDNLRLTCEVLLAVEDTPVIILHSGGLRCLDAMLICLDAENAWLETSFSLVFYKGMGTVEENLALAYRKVGPERLLYGSDCPYVMPKDSIEAHQEFFGRFGFSDGDLEKIFHRNALRLMAEHG